jgi:hypothetical protein
MNHIHDPWPITGTITPRENGYRASLDAETEWLTEGDSDDLQAAVDRAAREYGEDVTVEVTFHGVLYDGCSDFDIHGEVDA